MRRSRVWVIAQALLLGLILGGLALTTAGYRAETLLLDRFFDWRFRLFGPQPIDSRLLLVGIDANTVDRFGKPELFWQTDLGELVTRIQSGDPTSIGLDFLISPKVASLAQDDPVRRRLEDEALALGTAAIEGPAPVVLVELFREDEFSRGEFDSYDADHVLSPHEIVRDMLLQPDGRTPGLGIANISTDPDGTVRRFKLFHWKAPDSQLIPSNFALKLLQAGSERPLQYVAEASGQRASLTWNGVQVPFLFDESFLLNYPGPVEDVVPVGEPALPTITFPIVSASDVLDGAIPAESFKDKIVLLVPTALSFEDIKVVPGDHTYPGGAIHATVLNMFLTDSFLQRPAPLWYLLTTLAALLGAWVGGRGRVAPLVLGSALLLTGQFLIFAQGKVWLPAVFSLLAFVGGNLLGYVERLVTVERDRARVRATFARMVSPQVMQHVLKNMHTLEHGVRKEVTVLFTDINDFTPVCEKHEPEEVIGMLSTYFSLMVEVILKHDGYLKQYVGDEIMVIFGAPDDRDDHATRAVLTALEMREVLAKAKEEAGDTPGFYDIKAGINTGSVVVGRVGPEARWEYAAVGDNVNLGARVMSAAQKLGLDIGVSDATRKRYLQERAEPNQSGEDPVVWTSQGVQTFKGKISQMEVFSIQRRLSKDAESSGSAGSSL